MPILFWLIFFLLITRLVLILFVFLIFVLIFLVLVIFIIFIIFVIFVIFVLLLLLLIALTIFILVLFIFLLLLLLHQKLDIDLRLFGLRIFVQSLLIVIQSLICFFAFLRELSQIKQRIEFFSRCFCKFQSLLIRGLSFFSLIIFFQHQA